MASGLARAREYTVRCCSEQSMIVDFFHSSECYVSVPECYVPGETCDNHLTTTDKDDA